MADEPSLKELSFDYFPGMVFQRPPRFTCGEFVNEPALDWTGMSTKALKKAAARFPETAYLCKKYDWTLRASYFGLFAGPLLVVLGGMLLGEFGAALELRFAVFVTGLALLGGSILLNKDTSEHLRALVRTYNELALSEKKS